MKRLLVLAALLPLLTFGQVRAPVAQPATSGPRAAVVHEGWPGWWLSPSSNRGGGVWWPDWAGPDLSIANLSWTWGPDTTEYAFSRYLLPSQTLPASVWVHVAPMPCTLYGCVPEFTMSWQVFLDNCPEDVWLLGDNGAHGTIHVWRTPFPAGPGSGVVVAIGWGQSGVYVPMLHSSYPFMQAIWLVHGQGATVTDPWCVMLNSIAGWCAPGEPPALED